MKMKAAKPKQDSIRTDLIPQYFKEAHRLETPEGLAEGQPDLANSLLRDAVEHRVSDIHIEPRSDSTRIRLRIDGLMWDVAQLTHAEAQQLMNQLKAMAGLDPVARFSPRDAHATVELEPRRKLHLRLALTPCQSGETMAVRLLDSKRLERSIDSLGLTAKNLERLEKWVENMSGMFIAAGPTGSGKTTTVYALLHELKFAEKTIISLEDPVEYQVDGITQVQMDERHHLSFAEGVRTMLRLDPDYLMLGEIRDAPSAHAAVQAALSGRVLLTTVHSRDAVGAITVLRNWGVSSHEIAESVSVVVAQRLVRKLCPDCRIKAPVALADAKWIESLGVAPPTDAFRQVGCAKCKHLGYADRTGIFEFWQLNELDYNLIAGNADKHQIRKRLMQIRHANLLTDAMEKITEGVTSVDEIRRMVAGAFNGLSAAPAPEPETAVVDGRPAVWQG